MAKLMFGDVFAPGNTAIMISVVLHTCNNKLFSISHYNKKLNSLWLMTAKEDVLSYDMIFINHTKYTFSVINYTEI